jgi:hypothetical protein
VDVGFEDSVLDAHGPVVIAQFQYRGRRGAGPTEVSEKGRRSWPAIRRGRRPRTDQADDRGFVGEHPHDAGTRWISLLIRSRGLFDQTIRTDSRITSTPSPARNASSSPDTADWDSAIGRFLVSVCLAFTPKLPAMVTPVQRPGRRSPQTPPLQGFKRSGVCVSRCPRRRLEAVDMRWRQRRPRNDSGADPSRVATMMPRAVPAKVSDVSVPTLGS